MLTTFPRLAVPFFLLLAVPCLPAQQPAPKACRSVHLNFQGAPCRALYNEVKVKSTAKGTYYCVIGFGGGYCGIQDLPNGKKVGIFSVWDDPSGASSAKADQVAADQRVLVASSDPRVTVSRFGGEGTGAKSMWPVEWMLNEPERFLVALKREGERSAISGFYWVKNEKKWMPIATFQTLSKDAKLSGGYSFVEDFLRNGTSATQAREAEFGPMWAVMEDGKTVMLDKATFTADGSPSTNINAGLRGPSLFLQTGGLTKNETKLQSTLEIPAGPTVPEPLTQWIKAQGN